MAEGAGLPMVPRYDEIARRVVSVFLIPFVNFICFCLVVYLCSERVPLASSFDLGNVKSFLSFVSEALSELVKTSFGSIFDVIDRYKNEVRLVSLALLGIVCALFVLLLYIFDRVTYYVGYVLPPAFRFDVTAYMTRLQDTERFRLLRNHIDERVSPAACYGIVRAYLGERNKDQDRIAARRDLATNLAALDLTAQYLKTYFFTALVLIFVPGFSVAKSLIVAIVVAAVFAALIAYFSRLYRRLIILDIESFLWDRCYNHEQTLNTSLAAVSGPVPVRKAALSGAARMRFIQLSLSETLHDDLVL
jgi:hypothetical protein